MYELLKKSVKYDLKIFWGEDTIELRSRESEKKKVLTKVC